MSLNRYANYVKINSFIHLISKIVKMIINELDIHVSSSSKNASKS